MSQSYYFIIPCVVLYWSIILYIKTLLCTDLYFIALHGIVLYRIVLKCIMLRCLPLFCTILQCNTLNCVSLYCMDFITKLYISSCLYYYNIVLHCAFYMLLPSSIAWGDMCSIQQLIEADISDV